jgi:Cu(I)/Ag(I) efflux system membrane protein CusA/SilA
LTYLLTSAVLAESRSKVMRGSRSLASRSFTSSLKAALTRIGRAAGCWNTLNAAAARLPDGVTPVLGPDATGIDWVY